MNFFVVEVGLVENFMIGEIVFWQEGEEVFYWMCDGVVLCVDFLGVFWGDFICCVCFVVWWQKEMFLMLFVVGVGMNGVIVFELEELVFFVWF